ncbi:hypothetical protein VTO73DRAFT_11274 [Trametes versicolor]
MIASSITPSLDVQQLHPIKFNRRRATRLGPAISGSASQPADMNDSKAFWLGSGQIFPEVHVVHVGLKPSNQTALLASLAATGDPTSPTYGQHLSKSQAAHLAAPAPESMRAVTVWLQDHGLAPDADATSGNVLTVRMSLEKANSVLNANYSAFVHTSTNTTIWRTLSYSVPAHIDEHLSFIYPTTQFIPPPVTPPVTNVSRRTSDDLQESLAREQSGVTIAPFAMQPVDSITAQDMDGIQTLFNITNFLLAQDHPPSVLLANVQYEEAAFQQAPEIAQSLCNAFAQLGARGISVIAASGHSDVSGTQSCNGNASCATFPATCPYVTSVGNTQESYPQSTALFTSGGFSNVFPRPAYQVDAVNGYLGHLGNSSARPTGRAYPDVSAQGCQSSVEVDGHIRSINNTSSSSATFAAAIALLNDRLMNAGKPPLGFLNPLLYSRGLTALDDIISGNSSGPSSFTVPTAWDPIVGLGTPNFQNLLTVVTGSDADAERSDTEMAARWFSPEPTADAVGGSGLEGLFPFTASGEQDSG